MKAQLHPTDPLRSIRMKLAYHPPKAHMTDL